MISAIKNQIAGETNGKIIPVDIYYNPDNLNAEIVVLAHGFKGFKDWGHFELIAKKFASEGFVFVKFNFSHNGTSIEHPSEFFDLDAFGKNTYSIELDDLDKILNFLSSNGIIRKITTSEKINLIGHSRGGGISIIKTAEDKRISKLITWAAVSDFIERLKQFPVNEWKEKGVVYSANARTKQEMPLYFSLYEETIKNEARFNILSRASEIKVPSLIIHGKEDEAVPFSEAKQIITAIKSSKLILVEKGNHTFGGKHPYTENSLPPETIIVITETIKFIKEN